MARSNWAASDLLSLLPLATSLTHSQQNISTTHIRKYRVMVARMSFFFFKSRKENHGQLEGVGLLIPRKATEKEKTEKCPVNSA